MYLYSFLLQLFVISFSWFLIVYYLSQLEYDVLEYVVIERLVQSGREKLKDDGLNLSDWLQSLASFWGHLYVTVSRYGSLLILRCSHELPFGMFVKNLIV